MIRNVTQWMLAAALLTGVTTLPAFAQEAENQSKQKIEDLKPKNQNPSGEDIDETITNNALRAATGSKSKWSISTALNYSGGSIEKPLAEDRPNIAGGNGVTTKADIDGTIGVKRNFTAAQSVSLGVGVRWIAPLTAGTLQPVYNQQKHKMEPYRGERLDAVNPSATYQYLYKFAGIQSALTFSPTWFTQTDLTKIGYQSLFSISQDMVYEIGHSGLSLGLYVSAQGLTFDDNRFEGSQSDYAFGFSPFVEYQINDRVNLRTVANLASWEHIRAESRATTFYQDLWIQSVGVGIAVSRDIFLYPNLQFIPDNFRADRTNVALSTNINIF